MLLITLTALSFWAHTLATIILVGHYLLLALVYLPALKCLLDEKSLAGALTGFSIAIRPLMLAALLVFALTGIYLMVGNEAYQGLGQFSNLWSVLMLSKHILIFLMIGLGFRLNAQTLKARGNWLPGFTSLLYVTCACGLLVLLLTAFAQAL